MTCKWALIASTHIRCMSDISKSINRLSITKCSQCYCQKSSSLIKFNLSYVVKIIYIERRAISLLKMNELLNRHLRVDCQYLNTNIRLFIT